MQALLLLLIAIPPPRKLPLPGCEAAWAEPPPPNAVKSMAPCMPSPGLDHHIAVHTACISLICSAVHSSLLVKHSVNLVVIKNAFPLSVTYPKTHDLHQLKISHFPTACSYTSTKCIVLHKPHSRQETQNRQHVLGDPDKLTTGMLFFFL